MRSLTKVEVAAMWFFHDDYAERGIGAIEYYKQLPEHDKRLMRDMVKQIEEAAVFETPRPRLVS